MAKTNTYIKCATCEIFTENSDHCKQCGAIISHKIKQELKEKAVKEQAIDEVIKELENPGLSVRLMKHPFVLYKIFGWMLHSVFLVISAIGAFLAWFIAMVAAG